MVSPDSQAIACPLSGRNSTYRPVQISGTGSVHLDPHLIPQPTKALSGALQFFGLISHKSLLPVRDTELPTAGKSLRPLYAPQLAAWRRRPDAITFVQPIEGRVFVMQLVTKAIACFGFAKQLQGTPEDLAAINAVVVEMTEGFNKRDAVAVSGLYTSDAEFTNVL